MKLLDFQQNRTRTQCSSNFGTFKRTRRLVLVQPLVNGLGLRLICSSLVFLMAPAHLQACLGAFKVQSLAPNPQTPMANTP